MFWGNQRVRVIELFDSIRRAMVNFHIEIELQYISYAAKKRFMEYIHVIEPIHELIYNSKTYRMTLTLSTKSKFCKVLPYIVERYTERISTDRWLFVRVESLWKLIFSVWCGRLVLLLIANVIDVWHPTVGRSTGTPDAILSQSLRFRGQKAHLFVDDPLSSAEDSAVLRPRNNWVFWPLNRRRWHNPWGQIFQIRDPSWKVF